MDFSRVAEGLSHPHIMVMKILEENERLSVSAIGDRQFISRPQMTHIVDRLVGLGMAKRIVNEDDRRVIDVVLTDKGGDILKQCDAIIRQSIKQALSVLDEKDIDEMSAALSKLAEISYKLR